MSNYGSNVFGPLALSPQIYQDIKPLGNGTAA